MVIGWGHDPGIRPLRDQDHPRAAASPDEPDDPDRGLVRRLFAYIGGIFVFAGVLSCWNIFDLIGMDEELNIVITGLSLMLVTYGVDQTAHRVITPTDLHPPGNVPVIAVWLRRRIRRLSSSGHRLSG